MNIPIPTAKVTPLVAIIAMLLMAGAYLLFLVASWNQYQRDRTDRDSKIDALLDRLPKPVIPDGE